VLLEPFYSKQKLLLSDMVAALVVLTGVFMMLNDEARSFDSDIVQGVFWGVVSAFLFALRNLLQKYHYPHVSADSLMMHPMIALALMLFLFIDYPGVSNLDSNDWLTLVLLGVISTAAAHTLLSYSLKHLPAKSIAMISCFQPLFATLFAWLLLSEVPRRSVLIGGVIIISVALYESLKRAGAKRRV